MNFVEQRRQQQRQAAANASQRYSALTKKAALSKLTKSEDAELDELISSLGKSLEQVEADAGVFRRISELEPIAGECEKLAEQSDERAGAHEKLASETHQQIFALQTRLAEHATECGTVYAARRRAAIAAEQIGQHRKQHWQLVGGDDPAIANRRRHLIQTVAENPVPKLHQYDAVVFEAIMDNPAANFGLDDHEFFPVAGQTKPECDELLTIAKEIQRTKKRAMYLVRGDVSRFASHSHLIRSTDAIGELDPTMSIDSIFWIAPPGESADGIPGLISLLKMRQGRENKARREDGRAPALAEVSYIHE